MEDVSDPAETRMNRNGLAHVAGGWPFVMLVGYQTMLASGGMIFGWQGLRAILVSEGLYADMCKPGEDMCNARVLRLHRIYTAASFSTIASGAVFGPAVDRFGPRQVAFLGTVLVSIALVLVGFSSGSFDAFIPALVLLGGGGSSILLCGFSVMAQSNSRYKTVMMGMVGYSFDLGALVFSFWHWLYQKGVPFRVLVLAHAAIVLPGSFGIIVWAYPRKVSSEKENGSDSNQGWRSALTTQTYWFMALLFCFGVLKFNFYLANLSGMLEQIDGSYMFAAFAILFPAAGVIGPVIGMFFDANRPRTAVAVMNTFSLIHVAAAATTIHWLQYVSFAGVGLHRSALFGGLPQYLAYYFPARQLGTLMGVTTLLGGGMTGIEYLVTWIVVNHGEHRFRLVCGTFAGLTLLWYAFPVFMRAPPLVPKCESDLRDRKADGSSVVHAQVQSELVCGTVDTIQSMPGDTDASAVVEETTL